MMWDERIFEKTRNLKIPDSMNCFVIMPFSKSSEVHTSDYWDRHFNDFLKQTIEGVKDVIAHRSEPLRGDILRGIINNLINDTIVVADITDLNANVFWELGVRQSFKHGTITIAEEGTRLPFDIDKKGTLFYKNSHTGNARFTKQLQEAIKDCINNPERPDSVVLETISGRGSLYELITKEESIRKLEALQYEFKRNKQLFDSIVELSTKNLSGDQRLQETLLFRFFCLELLVVTRYVDNSLVDYIRLENFLSWIIAYNRQLKHWDHTMVKVDRWLIEENNINGMQLFFNQLPTMIEKALKVLQSKS